MTVSNKVDTRKLPRPVSLRVSKERPHVPPSNDEEQFITDALSEALNMKVNSIEDHFFDDLGANSLLLARFCAKLRMRKEWATTSMRDIYMVGGGLVIAYWIIQILDWAGKLRVVTP